MSTKKSYCILFTCTAIQPGQYLFEQLSQHGGYEVVFVWNRTVDKMQGLVPDHLILSDLTQAASRRPHLIVEVAHPCITGKYGVGFLKIADYMVSMHG